MKILDKILEFRRAPYVIAGIIFFCSLGVLSCFKSAEAQLTMLNHAASLSRVMVKSSDDLTNYARFFVTTKNEQWRTEFNNVLKVRNGEVADDKGITKSFKVRVKEVPFFQTELDKLLKAEELSNNLAKLEVEAFAWIDKGKPEINFDIQTHHYTAAQMLMFGDDYKKYKKEIVVTTDEFYAMVVNRLQSEYLFYMTAAWTLIIVINVSLLLLVMIIKHKDDVKPQRVTVKKAIPKPRAKKIPQ
jgi:uncharacterized integral membrane protein